MFLELCTLGSGSSVRVVLMTDNFKSKIRISTVHGTEDMWDKYHNLRDIWDSTTLD